MLVLTRKKGEDVVIPSLNITIRLVDVRGDRVKLGVAAPTEVSVHRREVWERICEFQDSDSDHLIEKPVTVD